MKKSSRINTQDQEVYKKFCENCHKRPVEVYQLDHEVCFECWQTECFISFADQVNIPEV